jgi:hypothetical protein
MKAKQEDQIIKDIIKRYGHSLDLKSTPYIITEIIRQFGPKLDKGVVAVCQPPGGPPPKKIKPQDILKSINIKMAEVKKLSAALEKSLNSER